DLRLAAAALAREDAAERLVGEDAGEVVDAAVALGLADDGDDFVGHELSGADAVAQAGRILHVLELDLCDFDRHSRVLLGFASCEAQISLTDFWCPRSTAISLAVVASQMRAVLSHDAVTMRDPSGLKA